MKRLVLAGYALLAIAWAFTNPPGAAPDEPANYVKALGVRDGQFLGAPGPLPASVARPYGFAGPAYRYANATTRWVQVPPSLLSSRFACDAFRSNLSAGCMNLPSAPMTASQPTYSGAYEPFVYALPSILSWPARDAETAVILIRLGFAATSLAFIALAIALLWIPSVGGRSMIGILLAISPMVIFSSATISASGPEICAGIAFTAAIIRIGRVGRTGSLPWVAFAVSGSVLALSRPLGMFWVGLGLLFLLALTSPRRIVQAGRPAMLAMGAIAAAMAAALAWFIAVIPHLSPSVGQFLSLVGPAITGLPDNLGQAVGVFGWLDVYLPPAAYAAWDLGMVLLVGVALALADRRQRLTLLLLLFAAGTVCVVVGAGVLLPAGLALQGRHVLAFLVIVPLFAGEILAEHAVPAGSLVLRRFVTAVGVMVALVQALAWYVNAQRYASGLPGPVLFFRSADWSPALGWVPWLGVVGLACLCLVLAAAIPQFARRADASLERAAA